ncbi:MAG: aldo/keto reductase [Pseudomonadota bacterium]
MTLTRRAMLSACLSSPLLAARGVCASELEGETRVIPSTGARIPVVGLGTWTTFNVGSDPALLASSARVMEAFFAEGGGMIDSSPMYGSSQQTVGHGLSQLGSQETLFAADKIWTSSVDDGPDQIALTRSRWRVPRFDLLQVHNLRAVEGHLEMLFEMKSRGALAHVGVTTSHGRRHDELEAVMRRYPLDFIQLTYNILDLEAERRLLPLARERGVGVIVNRPFRRGGLIESFRGEPLPSWAGEIDASSWAQILLKFVISHPDVTVAIPATTRPEHMRENKQAARGAQPDPDLRRRMAIDVQAI